MENILYHKTSEFFDNWTAEEADQLIHSTLICAISSDESCKRENSNMLSMQRKLIPLLREIEKQYRNADN